MKYKGHIMPKSIKKLTRDNEFNKNSISQWFLLHILEITHANHGDKFVVNLNEPCCSYNF